MGRRYTCSLAARESKRNRRFKLIYIVVIVTGILLDQLSKYLAYTYLRPAGDSVVMIPHLLGLKYVENTGAAFSIFMGRRIFLTVLPIIITFGLAVLLWYESRNRAHIIFTLGLALVISGSIGNIIDRITRGAVVDFLEFLFFRFPIFNLADIFITFGVIMVAVHQIFLSKGEAL